MLGCLRGVVAPLFNIIPPLHDIDIYSYHEGDININLWDIIGNSPEFSGS